MKKFLIKLFIFIVLLIGVVLIFEMGFREKPTVFKNKYEGLTQHASEVEILILGHSHAMEGVDPHEFKRRTYNMAIGLQNVYYDDYILNQFINRMDSLKFVLISTSYFHFYNTLPDLKDLSGENQFNTAKFHMYWGLDSLKGQKISNFDPKYNWEFLTNPARGYISMFKYYLLAEGLRKGAEEQRRAFMECGYSYGTDIVRSENFIDADGIMMAKAHSPHYTEEPHFHFTYNYGLYEDIVKRCKEKNVNVAIVLFPAWHTYTERLDEFQLDGTRRMMQQLATEYDNCYSWDYLEDQRFDLGDFQDATHLNRYGAIKMAHILDEQIDSLL